MSTNVKGTVLWYAASVVENPGNYAKVLQTNYWRYPALQPLMPFIDDEAPKKPRSLKVSWSDDGCILHWKALREVVGKMKHISMLFINLARRRY